jgi:hypothetical protein
LVLVTDRVWQNHLPRIFDLSNLSTKGTTSLLVYSKGPSGEVQLLERLNRVTHPGDQVRFVISAVPDESSFVLVASVDAAGKASIYFPYAGKESAALPGPGRWEVPGSVLLDEVLGPERVFAFFSPLPIDAEVVQRELLELGQRGSDAIRDTTSVDVPGTTQRSFLLFRVPRP